MTPKTQVALIASGTALLTWVGWFLAFAKQKQPALEALATAEAPGIAEEAAKAWIAQHYGLTPELIRRISTRVSTFTDLLSAIRR